MILSHLFSCNRVPYNTWLHTSLFSFTLTQLTEPEWAPDFGPAKFVPSWGATVTGARKFLIAYNVNLIATKQQAHRIALNIREAGRGPSEVSCAMITTDNVLAI